MLIQNTSSVFIYSISYEILLNKNINSIISNTITYGHVLYDNTIVTRDFTDLQFRNHVHHYYASNTHYRTQ